MRILLFIILIFQINCNSSQVNLEPNLDSISVRSETFCPTWNWHPFCVESKPNSIVFIGVLNNTTGDRRYFIDYYLDSFDTDIPVGLSLRIEGTFYNLKKVATEYSEALKLRSEISEEVGRLLVSGNQPIVISYSNRKKTMNFELNESETNSIRKKYQSVRDTLGSQERMKISK